jgi:hypothetical protein
MQLKGKFISRGRNKKLDPVPQSEPGPDKDITAVTESVINEIKATPTNTKLIKEDKINKIKNIVLTDDVNKKSIDRLNKFINFKIG